jgi:SNF2 family DNA or RNA helicase
MNPLFDGFFEATSDEAMMRLHKEPQEKFIAPAAEIMEEEQDSVVPEEKKTDNRHILTEEEPSKKSFLPNFLCDEEEDNAMVATPQYIEIAEPEVPSGQSLLDTLLAMHPMDLAKYVMKLMQRTDLNEEELKVLNDLKSFNKETLSTNSGQGEFSSFSSSDGLSPWEAYLKDQKETLIKVAAKLFAYKADILDQGIFISTLDAMPSREPGDLEDDGMENEIYSSPLSSSPVRGFDEDEEAERGFVSCEEADEEDSSGEEEDELEKTTRKRMPSRKVTDSDFETSPFQKLMNARNTPLTSDSDDEITTLPDAIDIHDMELPEGLTDNEKKERLVGTYKKNPVYFPEKIHQMLLPHQREGIQFGFELLTKEQKSKYRGTMFALAMGLGKTQMTITTVSVIIHALGDDLTNKRAIIIVPKSLVTNWVNEIKRWAPASLLAETGPPLTLEQTRPAERTERIFQQWNKGGFLVITYGVFKALLKSKVALVQKMMKTTPPEFMVIDEAHNAKNHKTEISTELRSFGSPRRIALTGTPLCNGIMEYYTQLDIVKPRCLGTRDKFMKAFNPIIKILEHNATKEDKDYARMGLYCLSRMIDRIAFRRDDKHLRDTLPPKTEYALFTQFGDEQEKLYKAFIDETETGVDDKKKTLILTPLSFLISCHPGALNAAKEVSDEDHKRKAKATDEDDEDEYVAKVYLSMTESLNMSRNHQMRYDNARSSELAREEIKLSPKLQITFKIIEDVLQKKEKILIFTQKRTTSEYLTALMQELGIKTNLIDGGTSAQDRETIQTNFKSTNKGAVSVLVVSTKVGGTGLNFTAANHIIMFENSWNPKCDEQAVSRIFRLGQTRPTHVYHLFTASTAEEHVYQLGIGKQILAKELVDKEHIKECTEVTKKNRLNFKYIKPTRPEFFDLSNITSELVKDLAVTFDFITGIESIESKFIINDDLELKAHEIVKAMSENKFHIEEEFDL